MKRWGIALIGGLVAAAAGFVAWTLGAVEREGDRIVAMAGGMGDPGVNAFEALAVGLFVVAAVAVLAGLFGWVSGR